MSVDLVVFEWLFPINLCRYLLVTCIPLLPGDPFSFVINPVPVVKGSV